MIFIIFLENKMGNKGSQSYQAVPVESLDNTEIISPLRSNPISNNSTITSSSRYNVRTNKESTTRRQCDSFTKKGIRCIKIIVISDAQGPLQKRYCNIHDPKLSRCSGITQKGTSCSNRPKTGSNFCFLHSSAKPQKKVTPFSKIKDEKTNHSELECVVCKENKKNIILKPCNHMAMCKTCSEKVTSCPLCREPIRRREGVYY